MNKLELEILSITQGFTQHLSYAVVLSEKKGKRRLPIVIGTAEAQAIAVSLENMPPTRPLTHDLFKNTLEIFEIDLKEVVITNLIDGIFYSKLVCEKDNKEYEIDSRTSDAIALSIRFNCPIYIYASILESSGIVLIETDESFETESILDEILPSKTESLKKYTKKELNAMLDEALNEENYEKAALIKAELDNRG